MPVELVRRAQAGDREAFAALATGAAGRMHACARLMLRHPDLADDVVQDTLVEAWRCIRGLRDPERFDAWLYRLLIRTCRTRARSERRRALVEVELHDTTAASARPDASTRIADRDEIERAFRRLTDDQRAILTMAFHADLPLAGIAAAVGIPVGTVKSRLNRATSAMRAALEAEARPASLRTRETA